MSRSAISALAVTIVTALLLVASLVAGNRPLLGLDLQGGAEIVLRPRQDPVNLELASEPENMERAASIIRQRVDAIGVAEPDVTVQGTDIVVQLPGVDDQSRAIELVGQTAQLRFRPVLLGPVPLEQIAAIQALTGENNVTVTADPETGDSDGDAEGDDDSDADADADSDGGDADAEADSDADVDSDADADGDADADADDGDGDADSEGSLGAITNEFAGLAPGESALGIQQSDPTETGTTDAGADGTDGGDAGADGTDGGDAGADGSDGGDAGADGSDGGDAGADGTDGGDAGADGTDGGDAGPDGSDGGDAGADEIDLDEVLSDEEFDPTELFESVEGINGGAGSKEFYAGEITAPEDDVEDQSVVLLSASDQGPPQVYLLGPTVFTGSALEGAQAVLSTGWSVFITFLPGDEGIGNLNRAAQMCYSFTPQCPQGQIAVVLDSYVQSQNGFEAPTFTQREVTLSSGNPLGFEEQDARDTAVVLDFGALPLTFDDPAEAGLVRSVSATLGRSSLEAGIVAGAIGLAIVSLYMFWIYGLLGVAAILSLVVSSSLLWIIVSYLSASQGLALTLAGIVGLIVAIGVSLDSNIVYFEQIKEYVAGGNGLRRSADRSFPESFRTVFWANLATLIGAIILYSLTIGSVRGFALMLGIASVLDLFATYFFMRPVVDLMVNSKLGTHPRWFGVLGEDSPARAPASDKKAPDKARTKAPDDESTKTATADSSTEETSQGDSGSDTDTAHDAKGQKR